jgi:sialic acid synthase SpsE
MSTMVIAEPGCTHEGSLRTMVALVELAAACGADVYKSQWVSDAEAMCRRRKAPAYLQYYTWLQFPITWHEALRDHCKERGLQYACTTFLPCDVEAVSEWVDHLKVSSFEASAVDHLKAHAVAGVRSVIVSMGLHADRELVERHIGHQRHRLLHCVSSYPTPVHALALQRMRAAGLDGFSDHSEPLETRTGALAVAAGATVVERHFRLRSCSANNPDYVVSMAPHGFGEYVSNIRHAERACSGTAATTAAAEQAMMRYRVT